MLTSLDKLATSGPAGACAQPRNVAPKATDLRCTSRSTAASRKGLRNQPPGSKINTPIGHLAMTFLSILLMQVDTNAKRSFKLNSTIFDEFDLDFH